MMNQQALTSLLSLLTSSASAGNTPTVRSSFDFTTYNQLMQGSPGGLKIFLALQNIQNIAEMLTRVKSPLEEDAKLLVEMLSDFRAKYREAAAARAKQGPAPRAEHDNTSQMDQAMFEQFKRFVAFQKEGNTLGAHTADAGMTEAQQASQLPE